MNGGCHNTLFTSLDLFWMEYISSLMSCLCPGPDGSHFNQLLVMAFVRASVRILKR